MTRSSPLALAQTELAIRALRGANSGAQFEVVTAPAEGDLDQSTPMANLSGRGIFSGRLREELLERRADLAVHSLKDVPTLPVRGLVVGAVLERGDPRDVFVGRDGRKLAELPVASRVGTSSARRTAILRAAYPGIEIVPVRGNLDTRLAKLAAGEVDGLILAGSGIARIDRLDEVSEWLDLDVFIPSPGQGVVAIECRADDAELVRLTSKIDHLPTRTAATAERAFLAVQGGDCSLPVGAYAWLEAGRVRLRGTLTGNPGEVEEVTGDTVEAANLGRRLGRALRVRTERGPE